MPPITGMVSNRTGFSGDRSETGCSGCAPDTNSHITGHCQEQCSAFSQPTPNTWTLKSTSKDSLKLQTSSKGANYIEFRKGIGQDGVTGEALAGWLS